MPALPPPRQIPAVGFPDAVAQPAAAADPLVYQFSQAKALRLFQQGNILLRDRVTQDKNLFL